MLFAGTAQCTLVDKTPIAPCWNASSGKRHTPKHEKWAKIWHFLTSKQINRQICFMYFYTSSCVSSHRLSCVFACFHMLRLDQPARHIGIWWHNLAFTWINMVSFVFTCFHCVPPPLNIFFFGGFLGGLPLVLVDIRKKACSKLSSITVGCNKLKQSLSSQDGITGQESLWSQNDNAGQEGLKCWPGKFISTKWKYWKRSKWDNAHSLNFVC